MAHSADTVQLKPQTLEAFDAYVRDAEAAMAPRLDASEPFLWSDADAARAQQVRKGKIVAQLWTGKELVHVPEGLIHDWVGAAWAPGVTVKETLRLVQDYDNHKDIYKPEVIDSKLMSHHGNRFKIYMRLLKKKIITVVLDTEHDVHYSALGLPALVLPARTPPRFARWKTPGKANEKILPADAGYGFLWRMISYWGFEERDGGVYIEAASHFAHARRTRGTRMGD